MKKITEKEFINTLFNQKNISQIEKKYIQKIIKDLNNGVIRVCEQKKREVEYI